MHTVIQVRPLHNAYLISVIYASPMPCTRALLWKHLTECHISQNVSWLLIGDFDEVLDQSKKKGGRPVYMLKFLSFYHFIPSANLFDLGFSGTLFRSHLPKT
ncbi:hypothetical protein ACH5RR_011739 [Cinchona calisaya]|uniref:Uncharacterized protein n=1 Tax=Cinchona calisaya TaxID=153742 RepID=A0ABD3A6C5_9GENT